MKLLYQLNITILFGPRNLSVISFYHAYIKVLENTMCTSVVYFVYPISKWVL